MIKKAAKLSLSFISDLFNELDAFGRFWLALGLVVLVVAARMSWKFGLEVSLEHAAFLACLTVVAAFGPMAAEIVYGMGRKGVAFAVAILCVPLLGIEFFTHAGYTAGLRGSNIETASVQNARYDGAQEAAKEDKANLEMWKAQLAKLMEQDAWTATVKADALRDELATLKERMAAEEKGARGRKAGRGKEFENLQNQANALSVKIAKVEQREDLTKRIEATQRILDGKRTVAATTEHKSSAVDHQNKFLIKSLAMVANGNLTASELQAAGAEQGVNLAMAFAGTGLPAFCLFMCVLFRRKGPAPLIERSTPYVPAAPIAQPQASVARETNSYVVFDDEEARKLKEAIRKAIAPRRLHAA